jgi:hypothetical protein
MVQGTNALQASSIYSTKYDDLVLRQQQVQRQFP